MATTIPAVDGGDALEHYSWSQVLADLTVTVPLAAHAVAVSSEPAAAAGGRSETVLSSLSSSKGASDEALAAAVAPQRRRLRGADVACAITASRLRVVLWPGTPQERVVLERVLAHEVVPAASEYSLTDDTLTVDLEKRVEGFWEHLCEGDRRIDIRALGPAVGDVGKAHDPNEPQRIENPDAIARVVKEHPELAAGLAQRMMGEDGSGQGKATSAAAAALVTQTASSATYCGASSFEW